MFEIKWKPEYLIGEESIDNEHQHLFEITKEAFKKAPAELKEAKIKEIINDLREYISTHFEHEEEFMSSNHYPELPKQQKMHSKMIEYLNEFIKNSASMSIEEMESELVDFMEQRFVIHIVVEDTKIHDWMVSRKN